MKNVVSTIRGIGRNRQFFAAVGFLSCMSLWILLFAVQEMGRLHTVSSSRTAGLASVANVGWDPLSLSRQGVFHLASFRRASIYEEHSLQLDRDEDERKVERKGSLQLLVKDAVRVNDEVQRLTRSFGGFVASASRSDERLRDENATLEIRIPADKFELARIEIEKLAIRVESEQIEATDVTKQYVDLEAALRNYGAEEDRYREILKQAKSVKDILAVTAPLENVRSKIDKTQGEFQFLKHQVEMSSLQIGLYAETESKVLGVSWRPWLAVKRAFHESLAGLVTYADFAIAFLIKLPVMLLWIFSVGGVLWSGYRLIRWMLRKLLAEIAGPTTEKA